MGFGYRTVEQYVWCTAVLTLDETCHAGLLSLLQWWPQYVQHVAWLRASFMLFDVSCRSQFPSEANWEVSPGPCDVEISISRFFHVLSDELSRPSAFWSDAFKKVPLSFKRRWLAERLHQKTEQPPPVQLEVQREHLLEPCQARRQKVKPEVKV